MCSIIEVKPTPAVTANTPDKPVSNTSEVLLDDEVSQNVASLPRQLLWKIQQSSFHRFFKAPQK
jgi:hypothetical protein